LIAARTHQLASINAFYVISHPRFCIQTPSPPRSCTPKGRKQQRSSCSKAAAARNRTTAAAMTDLSGKVALVTGATSGIGFETADYLAGEARSCDPRGLQ
jgi:hypothetical protein